MHAHAGSHGEQPAFSASNCAAGDSAQAHRARTAAQNPVRGSHRVFGNFQVLGHHVAGAKGNDPEWYGGTGEALDNVKNSAVATADNDGFVAFCYGPLRLGSRGAVLTRLHHLDRGALPAKHRFDASNISTPGCGLLEHWVDEEQDLSHGASARGPRQPRCWGGSEVRRLLPGGEHEFFQRLPLPW